MCSGLHGARGLARAALLCAAFAVSAAALAGSQTRSPGSCASQGGGGANWTSAGNAVSSNNAYATASVDGTTTDPLRCTNYGFSIPAGSTIVGIVVNTERNSNRTQNGGSNDASVRLVQGGVVSGSNLASGTTYTTNDVVEAHGSATELWGLTWTLADINAVNFGAEYTGTKPDPTGQAHTISIDHIQITVTYNAPPAAPALLSPANGAVVATGTPAFDWSDSADPDADAVTYEIEADNGGCGFPSPELGQAGLAASQYTPVSALADGTYCWHARAVDVNGLAGPWSATRTFTLSTVSAFNAVEQGAANGTTLKTKLSGTAFNLDLLALTSGGSISTAYTGTVALEIVDATTGGGACAAMTALQSLGSLTFVAGDAGRKPTNAITYPNAARDARIRITDAAKGITSCSTDDFSIRPSAFASVTSNMTNSGTSGTPVLAAGANFTITAVALPGYDGTPKIDGGKLAAHAGKVQEGTLSGNFNAANPATGTASGSAFTYSEVGNFTLVANGVYDDGFTGVDQAAGDCTSDFSNVLASGKYGCSFGNSATTAAIGRFNPDHFALLGGNITNRSDLSCPGAGFTYMAEPFQLTLLTLQAQNAANVRTQNYDGSFAKLDLSSAASLSPGARSGATNLTARLDTTAAPSGSFSAGNAVLTVTLRLTRTTPDGPFAATAIGVAPSDPDGVQLQAAALDMDVDAAGGNDHQQVNTTEFRFGRLRMQNALGPEAAVLPIPVQTEYWNGTTFIKNVQDDCTTIARANITLGGYAQNLNACDTMVNQATVTFSQGAGTLTLSAAGAGNNGALLLTPNLGSTASGNYCLASPGAEAAASAANMAYLQGAWSGGAWNQDPSARATFGLYGSQPKNFIFFRENY